GEGPSRKAHPGDPSIPKEICRVNRFITGSVACLVCVGFSLQAQSFDYKLEQSPARPAPKWLRIIDQGQNDPRLKGYFTPEGLKVEIVAEYPTVVNPVGMTFAED